MENFVRGFVALIVVAVLCVGGYRAFDGIRRANSPEARAARIAADRARSAAQDAEYAAAERERADKAEAENELTSASYALFQARSVAPMNDEQVAEFAAREAEATKRWEAAQYAVHGANWRDHQAGLEADAAQIGARRLEQVAERVEERQAAVDMTVSRIKDAAEN